MTLDLVTYLTMMVHFGVVVLHNTDPFSSWIGAVFTIYVLVRKILSVLVQELLLLMVGYILAYRCSC